jgi:beta-phosphoglucomutase-like phosphatase (HAD superfamily)
MNNLKYALIDLDGTILNVYKRYYRIFQTFFKQKHGITIKFDAYHQFKKLAYTDSFIAHKFGLILPQDYFTFKHHKLELLSYLKLDSIIPNATKALRIIKNKGYIAYLLTYRTNKETLIRQLKSLKIFDYFDEIINLKDVKGQNNKSEFIKSHNFKADDIIVGDSHVEYEAGQLNQLRTYVVSTGFLDPSLKNKVKIYDNIYEVSKII